MKYARLLFLLLITISLSSCSLGVDWAGFFHNGSTPDERFTVSSSKNTHSPTSSLENITATDGKYQYSFPLISDIHVRDLEADHLSGFLTDFLQPEDLFLLDCGDSTNSGTEEQLTTYRSMMDSSGKPWFAAIGNHDIYFDGWRFYKDIIGKSAFSFNVGQSGTEGTLQIIVLDSASGTLGLKQMTWLEDLLSEEADLWDHRMVVTHCQFFSTGLNTVVQFADTTEIYHLMNLFSTYGVDYVFMGHNHNRDDRTINGVRYITLDPLKKGENQTYYTRVTIDGNDISLDEYSITGN